jgi:hypothetical protein
MDHFDAFLSGLTAQDQQYRLQSRHELSPNFGDGVKDQAAAWA